MGRVTLEEIGRSVKKEKEDEEISCSPSLPEAFSSCLFAAAWKWKQGSFLGERRKETEIGLGEVTGRVTSPVPIGRRCAAQRFCTLGQGSFIGSGDGWSGTLYTSIPVEVSHFGCARTQSSSIKMYIFLVYCPPGQAAEMTVRLWMWGHSSRWTHLMGHILGQKQRGTELLAGTGWLWSLIHATHGHHGVRPF